MKKIQIRNIHEDIYSALLAKASKSERSLEGEARYAINKWVALDNDLSGAEKLQKEITSRLNFLLSQINLLHATNFSPSTIAEKILKLDSGKNVANWFSGHEQPSFKHLDILSHYFGCSGQWLKHGEGKPYTTGVRRINYWGDYKKNASQLLTPDEQGNQVSMIRMVRIDNKQASLYILREFENSLNVDGFFTNLCLDNSVGSGGFSDLCDFLLILKELYKKYTSTEEFKNLFIKSYFADNAFMEAILEKGVNHPKYFFEHGNYYGLTMNTWWEDIWDTKMIDGKLKNTGYYFWENDVDLIDRLHNQLKSKGLLS